MTVPWARGQDLIPLTQAHCCIPVEERSFEEGHTHALVPPSDQCNATQDLCKGRFVEVCNKPLMGISC